MSSRVTVRPPLRPAPTDATPRLAQWLAALSLLPAILIVAAVTSSALAEPLPTRSDVRDITLDNGLRVLIEEHSTPPGRVVMRLIVGVGSLDEEENNRGAAHFIQHMAFRGSKNFPDDSARRAFQSFGLELSDHRNAYSAFDHTAYTLDLPGVSEAILGKGLEYLADVLDGLTFPQDAFENERRVIIEELRSHDSPEQRVFNQLLPRLTPGSRFGRWPPVGESAAQAIRTLPRQSCIDFYNAWSVPSNTTLVIVGDADPTLLDRLISTHFGAITPRKAPAKPASGVTAYTQAFGLVQTDPDLSSAVIAAINIRPQHEPVTTHSSFRTELIDQLAQRLLTHRLDVRSFSGDASYSDSGAYFGNVFGGMWIAQLVAVGKPDQWRDLLADVVMEISRARQFGFTDAELTLVKEFLLTEARSLADSETTSPSQTQVGLLTRSVLSRASMMTGQQNLTLLQEMLPTVKCDEVSNRFNEIFDPARLAYIAELPAGDDIPSEQSLLKLAERIAAAPVPAPISPVVLETLIDTPPQPAGLVAVDLDSTTHVMTIRLNNGIVAHHREMTDQADRVFVRVTIAGGEIEETPDTRGVTQAAAVFFDRPATSTLTGLSIRDYLSITGVTMSATVSPDAVTIVVEAPPAQTETAFQLLRLALTDPVIEPAAINEWRQRRATKINRRKTQPREMLGEALAQAICSRTEVRICPLEIEQIDRVTLAAAQDWLNTLLASAPMELSITGPVDRQDTVQFITRYLGDLAPRQNISPNIYVDLRQIVEAPPPHVLTMSLDTQTDHAVVAVGFQGPDAVDQDDTRVMQIVEKIIRPQLNAVLRDKLGLVSSIRIINKPAQAYPGYGLFLIVAPTNPSAASHVAEVIAHELDALAAGGPGQFDVAIAQMQLADDAALALDDPQYWSKRLADLNYRGRSLASIAAEPDSFRDISPDTVRQTLARFLTKEHRIRIIIAPAED